jgi:hypothetical protein
VIGAIVDDHPGVGRTDDDPVRVLHLRLHHAIRMSYIDVTLTEHRGRWLASAMLADEPDIGTGSDPREALRASLAALGEPYASEIADSAELP